MLHMGEYRGFRPHTLSIALFSSQSLAVMGITSNCLFNPITLRGIIMFTKIKNLFVGIYSAMSAFIRRAAIKVANSGAINKVTGANTLTFWDTTKVSLMTAFGFDVDVSFEQSVVPAFIWNSVFISIATCIGAFFSLFGLSFGAVFAAVIAVMYLSVFSLMLTILLMANKMADSLNQES